MRCEIEHPVEEAAVGFAGLTSPVLRFDRRPCFPAASNAQVRKRWLKARWSARQSAEANRFRDVLIRRYGEDEGKAVRFAETFVLCEYGSHPSGDDIRRLFPFFGEAK